MQTLLVIDDEPGIGFSIQQVLESDQLRVLNASTAEEGLRLAAQETPAVVLLDVRLGRTSGLDLFRQLRMFDARLLVIFITGHGTADTAIEAMKIGAFDYLVKPLDLTQLQQSVEQALRISQLMRVPAAVDTAEEEPDTSDRLVGRSPAMQSICKQIGRIAPQDINVLVLGESGTGKELIARAIYHHSRRDRGPYLAINCAAIPEMLLESELFGHEKGAFTGAERRRIGKFEQCHDGTIFLDEVGDMPLATQAKILRLLQDGQFQRVGGNETLYANVRVIAATNQDLEAMIQQGRFRRDLYYRLRGVTLHLPPLRDRAEDIPELAYYFLFRLNRQLGTAVQSISPEALERLQHHRWPGNIRELQSVLREALIASTGPTLLPDFLPLDSSPEPLEEPEAPVTVPLADVPNWSALAAFVEEGLRTRQEHLYRRALEYFDRLVIAQAMQAADGFQSRAALALGISRPTMRAKLRLAARHDQTAPPPLLRDRSG
ncbi:MAG: sigma-54 dependent transcriptional regulator [Pirellulales bacterium]